MRIPSPPHEWNVADVLLGRRLRGVVRGALTSRPPRLPPEQLFPVLPQDPESLSRASTPGRHTVRSAASWETILLNSEYARPLDVLSENLERQRRKKILRRLFCCCPPF
ncbi:hypothetical protein MRX96_007775 [Rhipicephalus microplus]